MVCSSECKCPTSLLQMNYQRKYEGLNRAVTCVQWTEEEQNRLMMLHQQFGNNWSLLSSSYFPDRNANQLKCKYNYLANKKKTSNDRLMKYYTQPATTTMHAKKQESQTESHSITSQQEAAQADILSQLQMDDFDMMFDVAYDFE
uniref:Myb-like DNA-binding domain containing protein n=1 Tax=Trepomonas sp. PC1 TaxID=1076344 RepID=A0A146KLC8_9EUKA|eukprot:JAP96574.1 Myb-like DNA-binding domain containing protein [Trepomonas sp. PC1]